MRTRRALVAVVLAVLLPGEAGAHRHEPRHLLSSFVGFWNEGQVAELLDLFEADADYYHPFGGYARGRDAIGALLRKTPIAEIGRLELSGDAPVRYRPLDSSQAMVEWEAGLRPAGGNAPARVLLLAIVLPTSGAGAPPAWSFRAFRMIQLPTQAASR